MQQGNTTLWYFPVAVQAVRCTMFPYLVVPVGLSAVLGRRTGLPGLSSVALQGFLQSVMFARSRQDPTQP